MSGASLLSEQLKLPQRHRRGSAVRRMLELKLLQGGLRAVAASSRDRGRAVLERGAQRDAQLGGGS